MFQSHMTLIGDSSEFITKENYWPAIAADFVRRGKYSKAVEICRDNIKDKDLPLSGRLVYGQALYYANQLEGAEDVFYDILALDPENITALKFLGDIKFSRGNSPDAFYYYRKVLSLDPNSRSLFSWLKKVEKDKTHTITLKRSEETAIPKDDDKPKREIPFYTETMGDLYLAQGFPQLARDVYTKLLGENSNSRLREKLNNSEEIIKEKDKKNVKKTD